MRQIEASEMENWSFKGLPGTDYWVVDEPDENTKLLLSVLKIQSAEKVEIKPSYVFLLQVEGNWHLSPWLNDRMVDVLLRVAPPSVAFKRVMPQQEAPEEASQDHRS